MKQEALAQGVDLINLGVGDPDLPTPKPIIEKLQQAAEQPVNHRYPSYEGLLSFREAVANWYLKRFNVKLDPEKEVLSLIGSKEGIGHIPLAFVNPGEKVLVPDPGYPVYKAGTIFSGGIPILMPLWKENNFLPDLASISLKDAQETKLMFLNYPNNPTTAVSTKEFFKEVIEFAAKHNIIICHDAAYTEVAYDGYKPLSFLEVEGAKEVGIEFHSLSKTYNMTGWRIGFAAGNAKILSGLGAIKTNLDSGVFQAIQEAGITALSCHQQEMEQTRSQYQQRRDIMVQGLLNLGYQLEIPLATFYIWIKVPQSYSSTEFAALLLKKAGIVVTPGVGFGQYGEGYFRITLTTTEERLTEALDRLKDFP
jgi:LL-diaminopimelate aminotransferase